MASLVLSFTQLPMFSHTLQITHLLINRQSCLFLIWTESVSLNCLFFRCMRRTFILIIIPSCVYVYECLSANKPCGIQRKTLGVSSFLLRRTHWNIFFFCHSVIRLCCSAFTHWDSSNSSFWYFNPNMYELRLKSAIIMYLTFTETDDRLTSSQQCNKSSVDAVWMIL